VTLQEAHDRVVALGAALPSHTLRHDPRVHALQEAQTQFIAAAHAAGLTELRAYQLLRGT
jgi:hypothetical protein